MDSNTSGITSGMTVTIAGSPGPQRCDEPIFHLWSWLGCVRPKHHVGKHATLVGLAPQVIEWGENVVPGLLPADEPLVQLKRLAKFIADEMPEETSGLEGAVDIAIRLLRCYVGERRAMDAMRDDRNNSTEEAEKPFNPLRVK